MANTLQHNNSYDGHSVRRGDSKDLDINEYRQRVLALQQSAANLAQLDLDKLAALVPQGLSVQHMMEIRSKLLELNSLQQSVPRRVARSLSVGGNSESSTTYDILLPDERNSSRYKTELCRPFEENGVCKYGNRCQFAHGPHELRSMARHPKYKSQLCRTFHSNGLCPYGHRCHFIHNRDESRIFEDIDANNNQNPLCFNNSTGYLNANHNEMTFGASSTQRPVTRRNSVCPTMYNFDGGFSSQNRSHLQKSLGSSGNSQPGPISRPKSLSVGCSIGSTGELSPPASPPVASPEDPFSPLAKYRPNFFGSNNSPPSSDPIGNMILNATSSSLTKIYSGLGDLSPQSPKNFSFNQTSSGMNFVDSNLSKPQSSWKI